MSAFQSSRSVPLIVKSNLFESQSTHSMNLSVTDLSGRHAFQLLTIQIVDENEAPVLRNPDNPNEASGGAGTTYKKYSLKESAPEYYEVGDLMAWDPDANSNLIFSVHASDESDGTEGIFFARRSDKTIASADGTGRIYVAVLELRNASAIDYETQQLYTLNLEVIDGELSDTAIVEIEILNVNDVEVDDVKLVSSGEKTLQAKGVEKVIISGSNFGKNGINTDLKPRPMSSTVA